jgi:hypothetical protein
LCEWLPITEIGSKDIIDNSASWISNGDLFTAVKRDISLKLFTGIGLRVDSSAPLLEYEKVAGKTAEGEDNGCYTQIAGPSYHLLLRLLGHLLALIGVGLVSWGLWRIMMAHGDIRWKRYLAAAILGAIVMEAGLYLSFG